MPTKNIAELHQTTFPTISKTLAQFHSVLNVPENENEPVLSHPSFQDFLLDPRRYVDIQFQIDANDSHIRLLRRCMGLTFRLHENICNLSEVGILVKDISKDVIEQHLPPDVRYSCRCWLDHFQHGHPVAEDMHIIRFFIEQHYLHWLESFILITVGDVSGGIRMVTALEEMLSPGYSSPQVHVMKNY